MGLTEMFFSQTGSSRREQNQKCLLFDFLYLFNGDFKLLVVQHQRSRPTYRQVL